MGSDVTWLQNWYQSNGDGTWEHGCGVHIDTVDNPGWHATINSRATKYEALVATAITLDRDDDDWVHCFVKDLKFEGAGEPRNLKRF